MKYERVWDKHTILSIFVLGLLCTVILVVTEYLPPENTQRKPFLPVARMDVALKDTSLEVIHQGDTSTKYPNNSVVFTDGPHTDTFNDVEIKGRGNSTWLQDKKPYQLKFSEKTDFFNIGKAKKWILLADYLDSSHLRNDTAFYYAKMLNANHAISGDYVELYINDDYKGLYYLAEKVEVNKNRINLTNPLGIVVEYEGLHLQKAHDECRRSYQSTCLTVTDVVDESRTEDAMDAFLEKYSKLEKAAINKDWEQINELADVESLAKYYLISDFTANPDAFISSYFFYQDGPNDKIHVTAGWDFDLAFYGENVWGYNYGIDFYSPYKDPATESTFLKNLAIENLVDGTINESYLIYHLLRIPEFQAEIRNIYIKYLRGRCGDLIANIDRRANQIRKAAIKDNTLWEQDDFDESVDELVSWVIKRYKYFDIYYGIPDQYR